MKRLRFLAGYRALEKIRDGGLRPGAVRTIPGAAGGPKWLVLSHLDRALWGTWLKDMPGPVNLVGASAGAWRFAAAAQADPVAALDRLEHAYVNQRYDLDPSPAVVTATAEKIIQSFVADSAAGEILLNPVRHLHVVTARSRHLIASDTRVFLAAGFGAAVLANTVSRGLLGGFLERVVFHHPGSSGYLRGAYASGVRVPLSAGNLREALLASGSIPFVMESVAAPKGAIPGRYRDGGLVDYHLDLPYGVDPEGIVLFPHFVPKVIPGWLDKFVPWRRASRENLTDVVVVCPSEEFTRSLPMGKIPDRNDFYMFKGRDDERIRLWEATIARCRELADEFLETVASGDVRKRVEPLG